MSKVMMELSDAMRKAHVKMGVMLTLAICAITGAAFASEGTSATMATIQTATVSELTTVQQALLDLIQAIMPVAFVVMGSILVVTLGVRLFRRFAS